MRVLVVDDEPEIRDVLSEYLGSLGHEIRRLRYGAGGDRGRGGGDVRGGGRRLAPAGITGRDVLEGIAAQSPDTRVLVITGHVAERVGRGHLAGLIARVCHKPFSLRTLRTEIDALLGMRAPTDAPIA
jgi:CheY-like chemotaxis protein